MFWAIVGAGRTVARPGGQRQAPQQFGCFGKLVTGSLLLGIPLALNWRATVIVLGVLSTVTVVLALFAVGNARAQRLSKPDELDEAMADLLGHEGSNR